MKPKIAIGGDHAGFHYKESLAELLREKGYEVEDFGPSSAESVDYPDFAHPVASFVENHSNTFGILVCGSGNGVAMSANKHEHIRAAVCWNEELARLSRLHNDANILCVPARFVSADLASSMTEIFLSTSFEGGRHSNRVNKIAAC